MRLLFYALTLGLSSGVFTGCQLIERKMKMDSSIAADAQHNKSISEIMLPDQLTKAFSHEQLVADLEVAKANYRESHEKVLRYQNARDDLQACLERLNLDLNTILFSVSSARSQFPGARILHHALALAIRRTELAQQSPIFTISEDLPF